MSRVTVMIIDDEVPFVEALGKRLTKRDLTVITALSGAEGLKKLAQNPSIDIVILDVNIPGTDEIQTLRCIKRDYPLVEVIVLTDPATVSVAIEGLRLGACDYHVKPCDIHSLVAQLAQAEAKKAKHEEKILDARMKEIAMRIED